ncbi:hypothetical protein [Anaeromyxobacter oryzae]|uniref:hypothetical protein n=1 Tax=Anaeromyxobacter oryzae TaxID=2918170 RepID=UPI0020C0FFA0|nr:hypothetical protein [Anaeromyxobacter oryzae]
MLAASIGMMVQAIPSFVISIDIRHIIGIGIIIMPPGMPIPGIMPGIIPCIIPGIIPPMGIGIGIIGMPPMPMPIGMGAIIGMPMGMDIGIGAGDPDIIGMDMGMGVIGVLLPAPEVAGSIRAEHGDARRRPRVPSGGAVALSSATADRPPRVRRISGG